MRAAPSPGVGTGGISSRATGSETWTDTDLGFDIDRDLTPENLERLPCGALRIDVEALRRAVLDTYQRGSRQ